MGNNMEYRVWDNECGKMFYGITFYSVIQQTIEGIKNDENFGHWLAVTDHVMEQYTGLNDKNGEKIFEGDILDSITGVPLVVSFGIEYAGFSLLFNNNAPIALYPNYAVKSKIIGNIHENPDLLTPPPQ